MGWNDFPNCKMPVHNRAGTDCIGFVQWHDGEFFAKCWASPIEGEASMGAPGNGFSGLESAVHWVMMQHERWAE